MLKKVLVCITPQSNSKRLIERGNQLSKAVFGELHIVHIIKGNNIFSHESSAALLQQLFDYGAELGGTVHALCGEDIADTIFDFVKENEITNIIMGKPVENTGATVANEVYEKIINTVKNVEFDILERTHF